MPTVERDLTVQSGQAVNQDGLRPIYRQLFAGITSGSIIAFTFFPAEGLKKALQDKGEGVITAFKQEAVKQNISYPKLAFKTVFTLRLGDYKFWRGSGGFFLNVAPTTTLQFFTKQILNTAIPSNAFWPELGKAAFSGVVGASIATIVENTVVRQQVLKTNLLGASKDMLANGGIGRFWKSYPLIAIRDATFASSLMVLAPAAEKWASEKWGKKAEPYATLGVAVVGGAFSHPFDTIGTHLQKTHEQISYRVAAQQIYDKRGVGGFFKGFFPYRVTLFYGFIVVINSVRKEAERVFDSYISPISAPVPGIIAAHPKPVGVSPTPVPKSTIAPRS